MLVTEKYVLLNELISCDKLIRIWFENMKVEVIEFKSPNCSNNWNNWFMRDLNNGNIVFGGG